MTIQAVQCKGPGNEQVLAWSSGKLSLWSAASGGSMLSGNSKSLSASQDYTYYAQGDVASGSVRDSEINVSYTGSGSAAYDKIKVTVVSASFTSFEIIPVNTTQEVSVTVAPNPPGTNITLQLSCLAGSGSAVFIPGDTTLSNITQSTTVKIKGVTTSSVASNMILKVMLGNDVLASNVFTVIKVDLKVTHPQNPGPTGSAAKYNSTPNTGSADNLFATWVNELFRVNVNIQPAEQANNLPAGFIKWTAAGFAIPDNTTEYTFAWGSTGIKEITVEIPSCGITKKIRVDVPDVGIFSQTAAAALVGAPSVFVLAYAQEAIDYSNNNFPVGPQRDSFRHAYWMSLSVSQVGVAQWEALLISTGHEHDNRDDDHQQAFNSTMDLHNNSVGSGITYTTLLGTPDRTPIQNDITQQYTNGGLWVWAGGGAQENSEGILVKSDGSKIYSD